MRRHSTNLLHKPVHHNSRRINREGPHHANEVPFVESLHPVTVVAVLKTL